MEPELSDEDIQAHALKILEEYPDEIEVLENGSPARHDLARAFKKIAGVD